MMFMRMLILLLPLLAVLAPVPASAQPTSTVGVYKGNGCLGSKGVPVFASWLGARPAQVLDFVSFNTWPAFIQDATWLLSCWKGQGYPLVLSIPMLASDGSTLAQGAAGQFDATFRKLGELIVANGFANATLRVGWEFNVNNSQDSWFAGRDPANWIALYRRIVGIMRSVPGQSFRFDWNPALGRQGIEADKLYPGDDVVDVIGLDVYDMTWGGPMMMVATTRWACFVSCAYGLEWQAAFAKEHHKPISFPEWGGGGAASAHGSEDDAYFIEQMAAWMRAHTPAYSDYWDTNSAWAGQLSNGQWPRSGAAFVAAFRPGDQAPASRP